MPNSTSFTNVFGGTAVQPSQVSYAAYSIPPNLILFWPSTGTSTSSIAADNIDITATAVGATVTMPDATQVSTGQSVFFTNKGANTFSVLAFDGSAIASVPPPTAGKYNWIRILLTDNGTQAGTWEIAQLGTSSGIPQASALAGNGLTAIAGDLNTNLPIYNITASTYTFQVADRAKYFVYSGGQGTFTLPAANTFPNGWFVGIANRSVNGQLAIVSTSLIDGSSNLTLAIGQDCFITTDGTQYTTLGLGNQTFFLTNVNQVMLNNNASVTLTPQQATSQCQIVTGTQNQNTSIIFPNINGIYYFSNQTNVSAYSITVKVAGGATITTVPNGQRVILVSTGTDMLAYPTVLTDITFPDGSASDPGMKFQTAPTSGWFNAGGGFVGGSVSGTQLFTFGSSGLSILNGQGLLLNNDANSFFVTHVADPALASNAEYVWPVYPGADGSVLASTTAGILSWSAPFVNPMTTAADMVVGGAGGAPTRLAKGTANQVLSMNGGATAQTWTTLAIPSDAAKYIVQTPDASITNAQALSALTTGLLKNTTTTGVLSTAVAGTDYVAPNARLTDVAGFNTTKGGVVTANGTNLVQLPVGVDGQALTAASFTASGLAWRTLAIPSAAAKYIVQTPDASITNSQALSALTTGLLKNTTTTGVLSTAVAGTDYVAPNARLTDVAGFNTTKGGVVTANGTNLVQLPVGVDGQALTAASFTASGLAWGTIQEPQTVQGFLNTLFNTGAISAYTDITGLSAVMTPKSVISRILITVNVTCSCSISSSLYLRITRNGTPIGVAGANGTTQVATGTSPMIMSYSFLDSPASVLAQTYQVQMNPLTAATIYINSDSTSTPTLQGVSTITLQELFG